MAQKEAVGKNLATVFNISGEENKTQISDPVTKTIRERIFYGLADSSILITKQGVKIPADIIGSTIKIDENSIIGIVLIFYDIIESKRIYEIIEVTYNCSNEAIDGMRNIYLSERRLLFQG